MLGIYTSALGVGAAITQHGGSRGGVKHRRRPGAGVRAARPPVPRRRRPGGVGAGHGPRHRRGGRGSLRPAEDAGPAGEDGLAPGAAGQGQGAVCVVVVVLLLCWWWLLLCPCVLLLRNDGCADFDGVNIMSSLGMSGAWRGGALQMHAVGPSAGHGLMWVEPVGGGRGEGDPRVRKRRAHLLRDTGYGKGP